MCTAYSSSKLFTFDIIGVCSSVAKVYIKYCKLACDERSGHFSKEVSIVIVAHNHFCGDIEQEHVQGCDLEDPKLVIHRQNYFQKSKLERFETLV